MALRSIDKILGALKNQYPWQERQEFDELLESWSEVVGAAVRRHTLPLEICQGVLQVATSNSVWAQQLAFERVRILQKLNAKLTSPLKDIRFSTARWHRHQDPPPQPSDDNVSEHPSRWTAAELDQQKEKQRQPVEGETESDTQLLQGLENRCSDGRASQMAFERWAEKIQVRSQSLPLCPQCDCATPSGELQRWSVCALCAARQWGGEMSSLQTSPKKNLKPKSGLGENLISGDV